MDFALRKKNQLGKKDKSNIGDWDEKIAKLCEKINKKKEFYTTSSCAGRIVMIKDAMNKGPGLFVFRTHDLISFKEFKEILEDVKKEEVKGIIEFQQEPCILHVACKDLETSQKLLDKAKQAGWKKSGIFASRQRFVVELNSTENLAFPILKEGKILVDDDYLKLVVKEANKRLEKTWEKIKKLERLI